MGSIISHAPCIWTPNIDLFRDKITVGDITQGLGYCFRETLPVPYFLLHIDTIETMLSMLSVKYFTLQKANFIKIFGIIVVDIRLTVFLF
jgi:hypothetical protein